MAGETGCAAMEPRGIAQQGITISTCLSGPATYRVDMAESTIGLMDRSDNIAA